MAESNLPICRQLPAHRLSHFFFQKHQIGRNLPLKTDAGVRQHPFSIHFWMLTYASIYSRFILGCPRTPASIFDSFLDAHVRQHPFSIHFWMPTYASIHFQHGTASVQKNGGTLYPYKAPPVWLIISPQLKNCILRASLTRLGRNLSPTYILLQAQVSIRPSRKSPRPNLS